jgi:diketogulonate reductase-like aldo/keto reductase
VFEGAIKASSTRLRRSLLNSYTDANCRKLTRYSSNRPFKIVLLLFQSQEKSFEALLVNGQRVPEKVELIDTWRAMESLYEKRFVRAIGLSNFTIEQIQEVYRDAVVKPHNLQVKFLNSTKIY